MRTLRDRLRVEARQSCRYIPGGEVLRRRFLSGYSRSRIEDYDRPESAVLSGRAGNRVRATASGVNPAIDLGRFDSLGLFAVKGRGWRRFVLQAGIDDLEAEEGVLGLRGHAAVDVVAETMMNRLEPGEFSRVADSWIHQAVVARLVNPRPRLIVSSLASEVYGVQT